ncbi:MAG: hypothetical protein E7534_01640 [Ruminococcaceae bacterium]|nr:hypothetical protein [Oscillospiraceae bacterium]MBQ2780237.1 hypothetical protein [Clostridia bacterium]MBQ7302918.1 hypothetical protein [Clostridia bacterium]
MKVEITYPPVSKRRFQQRKLQKILKWPFWLAAYACPIINLCIGGEAWSVLVLAGLYTLWTMAVSPDLVEYNRISQTVKLTVRACIVLGLLDVLLVSGLAYRVIPIVCFGALVMSGVMFFTDMERQKQNMLPLLWLILFTMIGAAVGLSLWHKDVHWALIVMAAVSVALFIICIITLGGELLREIKRRFHTR